MHLRCNICLDIFSKSLKTRNLERESTSTILITEGSATMDRTSPLDDWPDPDSFHYPKREDFQNINLQLYKKN